VNIVIMGPPGVGKGTQSHLIVRDHGVVHISTGDILRMAIRKGTDLGKKVQKVMKKRQIRTKPRTIKIQINKWDQ